MRKVMAFGTFDIFHPGHINYLKQAKKQGNYLIVVVARDQTVLKIKKEKSLNDEQIRLNTVKNSQLAEKVILGSLNDKYLVIEKYKPDVVALGYDQEVNLSELKEKIRKFKLKTRIIRLKSYKPNIYKSSKLKTKNN